MLKTIVDAFEYPTLKAIIKDRQQDSIDTLLVASDRDEIIRAQEAHSVLDWLLEKIEEEGIE